MRPSPPEHVDTAAKARELRRIAREVVELARAMRAENEAQLARLRAYRARLAGNATSNAGGGAR
jgi:hypothetical protein